jgi:NADH:ubiquinone oxidoreductase subunit K
MDYFSILAFNYFYYIVFSFNLLYFGLFGIFINKRNIIVILIFFEIILLSVTCNFLFFSVILDTLVSQVFVFFILCTAGSEVSIGLAIAVLLFRLKGILNIEFFITLKG